MGSMGSNDSDGARMTSQILQGQRTNSQRMTPTQSQIPASLRTGAKSQYQPRSSQQNPDISPVLIAPLAVDEHLLAQDSNTMKSSKTDLNNSDGSEANT